MKKITRPYDAQDDEELFDKTFTVMSSTECTGLIPTPPSDEAEADSYSEIYDIPLAKGKIDNNLQSIENHHREPPAR